MNGHDALVMVFSRNAFYRRLYLLALMAFTLTLFVIAILTWVIVFLVRNPTQPFYFATDKVGRLIQVIPENRPNMTNEEVTAWVIEAVQDAFSYDFINYPAQLQNAQKYFTNFGWSNYMRALRANNNLLALTQRKWIVIAQVVEPPKIVAQGTLLGSYAWKYEVPILAEYWWPPYDENSKIPNALKVTVIVQRQSILQSYKGLGIVQIIGEMVATPNQSQEISNTPTG